MPREGTRRCKRFAWGRGAAAGTGIETEIEIGTAAIVAASGTRPAGKRAALEQLNWFTGLAQINDYNLSDHNPTALLAFHNHCCSAAQQEKRRCRAGAARGTTSEM